jgi:hypothetical protein
MFSLLEIFRITVSQRLFPKNLRGFSSENDYEKHVRAEQPLDVQSRATVSR